MLHAARAAAFLSIATGVNSILSALYPRYEPFYAYLLSVLVVAWLSSALLGVTTAIVAVVLYDWMFSPVRVVPSASFVVPLTVAVTLAVAARAAKVPMRARAMLPRSAEPPLLPPPPQALPPVNILRDDPRVGELTRRLTEAQARADDEAALRAEANVAAESRAAELTNEIESLRQTIGEQNGRWAMARREIEVAAKRLQDAEARAAGAQQELDAAKRRVEDESARAAREVALREQLEAAGHKSPQKTIGDLSTKYEATVAEARQRAEKLQRSLAELTAKHEAALAETQKRVQTAEDKTQVLQRELDRTLASLSEEHARADREAKLRSQLEAAARETLQRTANVSLTHQREAKEAAAAAQAAEQRAAALKRDLETLRGEVAAARLQNEEDALELQRVKQALEDESLRVTFESAARQKSAVDASSARREIQRLAAEIEDERNRTIEAQAQREMAAQEADEKLGGVNRTIQELQSQLTAAQAQREQMAREFDQKLQTASEKNRDLEARTVQMQAQREQMSREFDEKLQKIVAGITTDYEHATGEALIEKEAAKAELRLATKRIEALQSRAAKADAEWNEKLQKIVAHLTEDHEADLGEAMLQREGARAEARSLAARVTALQQKIEEERERFRQAAERWQKHPPASRETISQPHPSPARWVVLIVHSDAGTRAMARHALEQAGYAVLTAADGLEGLRTATQQKPDVVLAEGVMPKMNARELVQLLKSRSETAGVKIVLISSSGSAERGADFRADEVIAAPVNFDELKVALENVLAP
jgi:CheY-like chemotaxis protein